MNVFRRFFFYALLAPLAFGLLTSAEAGPVVSVKVSSSGGKVVYKGKTDSSGAFTTPSLPAGNYVVQFNADGPLKGGPFALSLKAGKETSGADGLAAGKFSKGGIAMKMDVPQPSAITGKLGPAGSLTQTAPAAPAAKGSLKTKVVDGREFVWIPPEQGGWLPGKWVAADSAEGRNAAADAAANTGRGRR